MKVVQILYSGLGGHGSVAFSLQAAAELARTGAPTDWDVQMTFMGIEDLLPEYARLCAQRNIPHGCVRTEAGRPWRAWGRLTAQLNAMKPDAIVLHSVKAILPCWLYAWRRGIPLIAVEHQPNSLKKPAEWVASRLLMRLANAVVVLTPDYRGALQVGLGKAWREGKVHLISNGIDTAAFAPPATPRTPGAGPVRVGMAARFSEAKRHDLLVGAMAILRDEDGPDAWRLSLAGDGETRAAIAARASAEGLDNIITLPGYLGEQALRDWFGTLDLYVHASDGETLSTSLLQAMAMGRPILGSDVPGINDLLTVGGGGGLLAGAQTPEAFAEALRRLAREPGLAEGVAGRARALALTDYSQDGMFKAYQKVLAQACARSYT